MDENALDIIHSVTIKRKPKKVLIPESVFTSEFHSDFVQFKENRPPNLSPWRVTSSGVVARGNAQIPLNQTSSESSYFQQNETISTLNLPKGFTMSERLRTPMRNHKPKMSSECDSIFTRNCEQLFSRMSTFKEVKPELLVDPSQSVRRIIKGSGLLKAFGTGLIKEDELADSRNPSSEAGTSENENTTIQDTTVSSSPSKNYETDLNSSRSPSPPPAKNSFQLFSSSPTTPLFYDTVVLKKTVETEFVEYLPPKNYEGFQLFSTTKGTHPETSSMDSPSPVRKKRSRFDDRFAENYLFQ